VNTNASTRPRAAISDIFFDGYSPANKTAELLNAIRAGLASGKIPWALLRFEEGGGLLARVVDVNPSDTTKVIFWANRALGNGGFDDYSGRLDREYPRLLVANILAKRNHCAHGVQLLKWFTDL